jgi:hypothetical protein
VPFNQARISALAAGGGSKIQEKSVDYILLNKEDKQNPSSNK